MNNLTSINPATDDVSSQESLVEHNISNIIHLPVPERLKAIEDIWDSIALEPKAIEVPQWHKEELRRRLEIYQSKPKDGFSWSDVRRRIEGEHQSKIYTEEYLQATAYYAQINRQLANRFHSEINRLMASLQ